MGCSLPNFSHMRSDCFVQRKYNAAHDGEKSLSVVRFIVTDESFIVAPVSKWLKYMVDLCGCSVHSKCRVHSRCRFCIACLAVYLLRGGTHPGRLFVIIPIAWPSAQ